MKNLSWKTVEEICGKDEAELGEIFNLMETEYICRTASAKGVTLEEAELVNRKVEVVMDIETDDDE